MTTLLSRAAILDVDDFRSRDVEVPEWGGAVRLRCLSGVQRDEIETRCANRETGNLRARMVAMAAVDDDGKPLFTAADVAGLGGKNAAVLDRLFDVVQELSGLADKDLEELEGNSGGAPGGATSSG